MRAVNLLPRDAAGHHGLGDRDPVALAGAGVTLVVAAGLAAGVLVAHSHVSAEQAKLDAAQTELTQLIRTEPPPAKASKHASPPLPAPAVTSQEQPRLQAVAATLSTRIAWDRILREFSLVAPADITIQSLSLRAPAPAAAGGSSAGNGLSISGLAFSHDSVARFLSRLMLIPDLSDVTLGSSSGDPGNVSFSITATVKGAPAPATPATPASAASAAGAATTGASS